MMNTLSSAMTDMLNHLSMALIVVVLLAGVAVSEDKPPPIYVDVGACPFECCTYRMWTVNEGTTLWNAPDGNAVVGSLRKGDSVQGLTGEVISKPLAVKADHNIPAVSAGQSVDAPDISIRKGDTFYVLHYDGEGYWKVWLHGKIALVHESAMIQKTQPRPKATWLVIGKDMPHPKADWWVKVKDAKGNVGWALSEQNFLHQDSCE
jgi:hypothetical protein